VTSQTYVERRRPRRADVQTAAQTSIVGRSKVYPYAFIGPAAVIVGAILAFPVLYAAYSSMLHDDLLQQEKFFVGLANYVALAGNPDFWSGLRKSAVFVFGTVAAGQLLAVVFAFALNRALGALRFVRALTIIPYIVSSVAVAVMFRMFFNADFGLPNQILNSLGVDGVSWLGTPGMAMVTVIIAQIWGDLPLPIIIVLAGLQTIDTEMLDAASVDGATGWSRARYITLPLISPQLILSMVFLSFTALTTLGTILALTGGGPGTATQTLPLEMYRMAFDQFDMGQAMAVAIVIFLMNAVLAAGLLRLQRRYGM
jgi:ABC-type sugar transport system permease subunit